MAAFGAAPTPQNSGEWKLLSIHVEGAKRFSETSVAAAFGLRVGEIVTQQKLESAALRLSDSGAFQSVSYRFQLQKDGLDVTIEVVELKNFLVCRFDNFTGLTDQELTEAVRKEVPLFDGSVPPEGQLIKDVENALSTYLREKKSPGEVQHILGGELGAKGLDLLFRVSGVPLAIQEVEFHGVTDDLLPPLKKAVGQLLTQDYSRFAIRRFAEVALVPLCRERGYLRAQFLDATARNPGAASDAQGGVSVTLPLQQGPSYFWEKLEWTGNQVITGKELDSTVNMKSGELANGLKIDAGWEAVQKLYGSRGYIDARLRPEPAYDDSGLRVSFRTSVEEGAQYHMAALILNNFPENAAQIVRSAWQLKPGQVYNASYLSDFLKNEGSVAFARARMTYKSLRTMVYVIPEDHLVNVIIEVE